MGLVLQLKACKQNDLESNHSYIYLGIKPDVAWDKAVHHFPALLLVTKFLGKKTEKKCQYVRKVLWKNGVFTSLGILSV